MLGLFALDLADKSFELIPVRRPPRRGPRTPLGAKRVVLLRMRGPRLLVVDDDLMEEVRSCETRGL